MNLLARLMGFIALVPGIVHSVELLKPGTSGADKKQAVLGLAATALTGIAAAVPSKAASIPAAQDGIGQIVDGTVAVFNAFGLFK